MTSSILVWLRNDLRIADNPALAEGMRRGPVVAVHVEETDTRLRPMGAAARWWRHLSLRALAGDLAAIGVRLETIRGSILDAVQAHRPTAVLWNRRYAPPEREVDDELGTRLARDGIEVAILAGNVLVEPDVLLTRNGGPYGVYTPFWNALRTRDVGAPQRAPRPQGGAIEPGPTDSAYGTPPWAGKLERHWKIGEAAARERLRAFLEHDIAGYPEGRDFPARSITSKLSPHLAHGEISARQVWQAAQMEAERSPGKAAAIGRFLMELAWRDFNIHQLFHRPDIATQPMQPKFARLQWRRSDADLRAWQRGRTGFAIIDAGMAELWETGFMHNRVRMLAASLLSKNLLLDWRLGEQWFWDCLVDADTASNPGNWQWVAGCGNDAAPYFRIFNPLTQAEKFDPDGAYVRRWAPRPVAPIVDLKASRERALAAFRALEHPE